MTIPSILYSYLGFNFVRPNAAVVALVLVIPNVLLMLVLERLMRSANPALLGKTWDEIVAQAKQEGTVNWFVWYFQPQYREIAQAFTAECGIEVVIPDGTHQGNFDKMLAEPLAALPDVLALCARLGLGLTLEIKATWGLDAACAGAVLRHIPPQPAFPLLVTSFSVTALQTVRRARPDLSLGLACLCPQDAPSALKQEPGLRAVHINDAYATEGRIAALRAADLGVAVATVNDLDRVAALLALGAHGVMTDHAAFARRFD